MTPLTQIETYFIAVPAGAQVVGGSLHLSIRVVVEWRLPEGTASPEWLKAWSSSSAGIAIQLENSSGVLLKQVLKPSSSTRARLGTDLSSRRSKINDRRFSGSPRTVRIGPIVRRWTEVSAAFIEGNKEPEVTENVVAEFVDSFPSDAHPSAQKAIIPATRSATSADEVISSRLASRYPDLAKEIGLAWELNVEVADWVSSSITHCGCNASLHLVRAWS